MSDNNQPKYRFFVEFDKVRHIPTGKIYDVCDSGTTENGFSEIQFECYKLLGVRDDNAVYNHLPFEEFELIESAGVYMGAGLKKPTYQDGYFQGAEHEIKTGYVSSVPSDPQLKPHPHYARINANTWALFGYYGIDSIQIVDNGVWVIHYQQTKSQSLEPRFTRAFLDRIGLTEDYEPRIGNQDEWERVFNQEYTSNLDRLTIIPNYPDTPAE